MTEQVLAVRSMWGCDTLLGEGPVWDERTDALYFVDLKGGAVHCFKQDGGTHSWHLGGVVSAVALTESTQSILCLTSNGFERLSVDTGGLTTVSGPVPMSVGMRPNDGKCDAHGNIWLGTMEDVEQQYVGSLYRIDPDGRVELKLDKVGVANGMGWSPDGRLFYFTDSMRRAIYRFEFDVSAGSLGEKTLFAQVDDGAPDGLTVDSDGFVWSAIWDGWRIVRFAPDGRIDRIVELPIPRPTSVAFGDHDLATLYITSARIGLSQPVLDAAPLSGALLSIRPGVSGLPANRARTTL